MLIRSLEKKQTYFVFSRPETVSDEDETAEYALVSDKQEGEKEKQIAWLTEYLPPVLPTICIKKPAQEDNAMNKSVTSLWNVHKNTSTGSSPAPEEPPQGEMAAATAAVATPVEDEPSEKKSKKRSKSSKESSTSKRHKSKKKKEGGGKRQVRMDFIK